jgi:hypothetical protein
MHEENRERERDASLTFEKLINIAILSLIIGIILTICLFLRERFAANFKNIVNDNLTINFDTRYVMVFALILIPAVVSIFKNLDKDILLYIYFMAGFLTIGPAGYILTGSKAALISGLMYPILYFNYWNTYTFDLIAVLLGVSLILLMSNIISWKVVKLFFALLLIMDITLVFITKGMVTLGNKILSQQIPILIHIPYGRGISIGLGDIFILGLLGLLFTKEKGYKNNKSLKFMWMTTALLFIILYLVSSFLPERTYPATIFVGLSFIGATVLSRSHYFFSDRLITLNSDCRKHYDRTKRP